MNDALHIGLTIVPKSDQLNADDLLIGPATVKITGVKVLMGDKEQPVHVAIEGRQPYKPCKSMRRVLATCWGPDASVWVGRSMTLYCDPEVQFGGLKVGGIRISHVSHIERDMSMRLTQTRGKKAEYLVRRLVQNEVAMYPADKFATGLPVWRELIVAGKNTPDQIIAKAEKTSGLLTDAQKAAIRAPFDQPAASDTTAFDAAMTAITTAADLDALVDASAGINEFPPNQLDALKEAAAKRHAELSA